MSKEAMKLARDLANQIVCGDYDGNAQDVLEKLDEALANHIPDDTKMVSGVKDSLTTQQEQVEPYGYLKLNTGKFVNEVEGLNPMKDKRYLPLYTTPQQRTWVGLTELEAVEFVKTMERGNFFVAIYDIEKKLKEKNT